MIRRRPSAALAPFVETLWASSADATGRIERVLPTGAMHLVVRLGASPLAIYDDAGERIVRTLGPMVLGGARSSFYVRDVSKPTRSIGAQLRPGASMALFGVPADRLAETHTDLADLWPAVGELRDRLGEAPSLAEGLAIFESFLVRRLAGRAPLPAMIAASLARLRRDARVPISTLVRESGASHRGFLSLFRASVGLSPATYRRVVRAERALALLGGSESLASVAAMAGYADQAHCTRELVAIAGITPSRLRRAGAPSHHVKMG